ncbi:MAG TPA: hypothetical protein EYP35_06790 [Desulfobacterales bacterium]|nr:hypothetical protein [Desulfobacterales bacterium]HIP40396.1 hypothetical protein [Desulfocapsa sulfexigens]
MKRKVMLLMASIAILSISGSQALAVEDDVWTDYDPCGWNVEEEDDNKLIAMAPKVEVEDAWTDYDPCGWNVEDEEMSSEVVKAYESDDDLTSYL